MGFLLKICWSIESKLDRSKKRRYKFTCMSLFFTSGQFGESQTLRKSEAFSKRLGRIMYQHTAKAVQPTDTKYLAVVHGLVSSETQGRGFWRK